MSGNEILIIILITIIGASFGSFITAASWRLPREEDIVFTNSQCPKCKAKLRFLDLIPVFSWLFSGGKCRYCKNPVSVRYVLTELLTTLVFLGLYARYGIGFEFIVFSLLAVAMLVLIISDFETYIIPDSTTVAAFILALIYHYNMTSDWTDYIFGFVAGLVVAFGLHYGFYLVTKREGLGFGDVKFLPVAGLWIGFTAMPLYFVIAGVLGILTGVIWKLLFKNPEYPFGPALAIAMLIFIIFPEVNIFALRLK